MNSIPEFQSDSEIQLNEDHDHLLGRHEFVQESGEDVAAELEAEVDAEADKDKVTKFSEYEFVADLLRRQDEVLNALDDLNDRIELAIKEISAARQAEIDAQAADQPTSSDGMQAELAEINAPHVDVSKAA